MLYKLFQGMLSVFSPSYDQLLDKRVVEDGVVSTLKDYNKTIKFFEKYDKGQVSSPKILDKYKDLRDYIQYL